MQSPRFRLVAPLLAAPLLAALIAPAVSGALAAQPPGTAWTADQVKAAYAKREVKIQVRDGIALFTSIYVPRDSSRRYPVLMSRTPYSVAPYGAEAYRPGLGPSSNPRYAADGYIFVYQDVRGRHFSEGVFRDMTPALDKHDTPNDVDEATDTYDTIEWLLKNLPTNGKVGIYGTSYPGFYASASCLSRHPALVACSPQAPMTDIWMGDDNFHGGAFLLPHNFGFYTFFGRGPRTEPGYDKRYPFDMGTRDAYKFYLEMGSVADGARKYMQPAGTAAMFDSILLHPAYDDYWKARNLRPHLKDVKAAVLTVGGFYDTEDLHGPWWVYESIAKQSPATRNRLVVGPWSHGGWSRGDGNVLGNLRWRYKTGPFYRDTVEYPFFAHYLAGAADPGLPGVLVYRTGGERWDRYDTWPAPNAKPVALYLHSNGTLAFTPPAPGASFDEYVSDPARPVPVVDRIEPQGMPRDYITADQRHASRRPDVLTYQTSVLTEDVTLTGPVSPVLHVSTSGTDADFIVKLIDVFPDSADNWADDNSGFTVGGYQQLVRGEPIRMRYRRSWEKPSPMVANRPDSVRFEMPSVHHTFRKGHRIMVQVQSSWFPHIDRNPQKFVPNIFEAKPGDFVKATMRVYHDARRPTRLELRRLDP
ncbi:MAG: CocE/NonD family hydrolase [Gemmatimonadaceae bacterium]|nr:CocE/NonD family hydrolase [Gemmatimonadaceae bacterium]